MCKTLKARLRAERDELLSLSRQKMLAQGLELGKDEFDASVAELVEKGFVVSNEQIIDYKKE